MQMKILGYLGVVLLMMASSPEGNLIAVILATIAVVLIVLVHSADHHNVWQRIKRNHNHGEHE